MEKIGSFLKIISFFIFSLFLTYICYLLAYDYLICHKAKDWVKTECEINKMRLNEVFNHRKKPFYEIDIEYSYKYDGVEYLSKTIQPNKYFLIEVVNHPKLYEVIIRNHKNNEKVFCYVNPNNPNETTLTLEFRTYRLVISLFLFLPFSLAMYNLLFIELKKMYSFIYHP